jgi:FkbM family methyltransferase
MSFSQVGEDLFLNNTFFNNKKNGTYIELGALDGVLYSNTKFFEDTLHWKGVLIEPHPEKFKLLEVNRPNNYLFNTLVSTHTQPLQYRYFKDAMAAVSGVENTLSESHLNVFFDSDDSWKKTQPQGRIQLTPSPLTYILEKTPIKRFDLLSLDVEGHEYEVLQSWDFSKPIDIILIEMLGTNLDKDTLCRNLLNEKGYKFYCTFKHNEIYVLRNSQYDTSMPMKS